MKKPAIISVLKPPPEIQEARQLISSLHDKNGPQLGLLQSWDFGINTVEHRASGQTIKDLYHQTCRKLEAVYPKKLQNYFWRDEFGYPRWATVVCFQRPYSEPIYLLVQAYENNDNASFRFVVKPGKFDTKAKERTKYWALPQKSFMGY